jgi:Thiamine pyrophosphate enzyme, N-terminal TPP binding domain
LGTQAQVVATGVYVLRGVECVHELSYPDATSCARQPLSRAEAWSLRRWPHRLPAPSHRSALPTTELGADASAADILVETLIAWDVPFVFGIVGDGIYPITESLRQRQDRIRYLGVRHEEAAAFMATGYAKYTGKLGVCLATTGPGAVHLMNGLYDACMDGATVLAVTGSTVS